MGIVRSSPVGLSKAATNEQKITDFQSSFRRATKQQILKVKKRLSAYAHVRTKEDGKTDSIQTERFANCSSWVSRKTNFLIASKAVKEAKFAIRIKATDAGPGMNALKKRPKITYPGKNRIPSLITSS